MSPATFDPSKLQPAEVAILALTDPKLKLSTRVRKALMRQREMRLIEPPVKIRQPRIEGISPKLDKANAKRDARRREGPGMPWCSPKPESERIIEQLAGKSMVGLIRFVKRCARRAATAMYAAKQNDSYASEEQTRQLALFRAGARMIQTRINPPPSNEII